MALNLPELIVCYLQQNPGRKFTAREIAEWVFENYPKENEEKIKNSSRIETDAQLKRQYAGEIAYHRRNLIDRYSQFKVVKVNENSPLQCYWVEKEEEDEIVQDESSDEEQIVFDGETFKEEDLYPLLRHYLWYERNIYPKRIDDRKSLKRRGSGGNKWLHPDIVGVEDLMSDWHSEVKNLAGQYGDRKVKFWSFEVKPHLKRYNVRGAFLQTISNSSWANFGYLVAAEIEDNVKKELEILSSLHGIGLIELSVEFPAESRVIIPARERMGVDWATCNRLAEENSDFLQFLKLIRQSHQTGDPLRKDDWDIPKDE